jgi:predicted DNA-binding transcriptional regulator AlpA
MHESYLPMNTTTTPSEDRLIDFKEVAHLLGDISERSVRRLIARGDLPQPVKILSAPKLYQSDVFAYLEKLKAKRQASRR